MHFRTASSNDLERIRQLYISVAAKKNSIARSDNEVTKGYVLDFISKSLENGLIIVCEHPEDPDKIIAEIHAYKKDIACFDHVLSDLTIVVDPEFQGKKIGRTLFSIFLEEIANNRDDIGRVELMTRESNERAIALYLSLGFRIEGRMEMRVKSSSGSYEADIPMGWQNPNFDF